MSGSYTLTVTVNNCASLPSSTTVTVNPAPTIPGGVSNTGPYCTGQTIQLNAPTVPGATYSWTGPGGYTSNQQSPTRTNATVAMSGSYTLTVTVNNCASLPSSTTVTVNPTPTIPGGVSNTGPYCEGQTIQLNAPTIPGATYAWTGPGGYTSNQQSPTRTNATVAMSGSYTLTVTVNNCASLPSSTTVTVNPTPAIPGGVSNTGPYCEGQTIQLNAPTVAGATYAWTGPGGYTSNQQSPTRTNATAAMSGSYTLTVTVSGCISSPANTSVTVIATPTIPGGISNTGPYCTGQTIQLNAPTVPGATYAWTGPGGYTSNQQNPSRPNSTTNMTGTYSLTVTVSGCASFPATTSVTVNATPTIPGGVSNNGPYCPGQTIQLNAPNVPGATYAWTGSNFSSSQEDPAIPNSTPANSGIYSLVVTVNGCQSAPSTTQVTVNPTPAAPTGFSPQPFCSTPPPTIASLSVQGLPGATFTWYSTASGGSPLPTNTTLVNGITYYASQTSSGCESTLRVAILVTIVPTITPAVSILTTPASTNNMLTICSGTSVTFSASPVNQGSNPMYQWKLNNSNIPGATNSTYTTSTLTNNSIITVTLTNNDPCSSTNSPVSSPPINVTVNPNPTLTLNPPNPTVCYGATTANLLYMVTNTPSTYSIDYDVSANNAGFIDVVDQPLPTSGVQIVLQIPANLPNIATTLVFNATISVKTGFSCISSPAVPFTITINPTPQFINLNDKTICGGGAVSILLNTNVNSNFKWKALADNPNISGESTAEQTTTSISDVLVNNPTVGTTQTVTYTVTATSTAHGCPATEQVVVTVNPRPNLEITATFTPTAGGQTTGPIDVGAGFTSCFNYNANVNFSVDPPMSNLSYFWTNSNPNIFQVGANGTISIITIPIPPSQSSAQFSVTVTNSVTQCTASDGFIVNAAPIPVISSSPSDASGCEGDTFLVNIFGTPLSIIQIEYEGIDTIQLDANGNGSLSLPLVSPNTQQSVTITPSFASGCTGQTKTFNLTVFPQPQLTISEQSGAINNDNRLCFGGTINFNGDVGLTGTVNWTPMSIGGSMPVGSNWSNLQLFSTTDFHIELTSGAGCELVIDTTIEVFPEIILDTIVQNPCVGAAFSISSGNTEMQQYTWYYKNTGAPATSFQPIDFDSVYQVSPVTFAQNGDYKLVVRSFEGCKDSLLYSLTVNDVPELQLSTDHTTVCQNAQVFYKDSDNVTAQSTYSWAIVPSTGYEIVDTTGSLLWVHWLEPGTYQVITTESYGTSNVGGNVCSDTDTLTVVVDGSNTALADTTIYHAAINNILISLDSLAECYEWGYYNTKAPFETGVFPQETFQAFVPAEFKPDYLYWVKSGTDSTCSCYTISYRMADQIGNEPPEEAAMFAVYPNPNRGSFRLEATKLDSDQYTIQVFDTWGRKVMEQDLEVSNGSIDGLIALPDVASGLFTIRLLDGNGAKYKQMKMLVLR